MEEKAQRKQISSVELYNTMAESVTEKLSGLVTDQYFRSSSEDISPLAVRSTTWPPGPEARSRSLQDERLDELFKNPKAALPSRSDKNKPRTRFSLPTIQELQTYERDPEFAKLDDRPKRGLNLPRSKSVKPSMMSKMLLGLDDVNDEQPPEETWSLGSPSSSASSPASHNPQNNEFSMPSSIDPTFTPLSTRRT
jgi:hypothetical protein